MGICWHIGNTTVRSPYRLRNALIVLAESPLNGNLAGRDNETAFARLLHDAGVLSAERIRSGRDSDFSDLGRKWRSALAQLGLITPSSKQLERIVAGAQGNQNVTEKPYRITPSGRSLISAETVLSQQESFLRTISAYRIPSVLEDRYSCTQFSPFEYVVRIVLGLEAEGLESFISILEMATIVQTHTPGDNVNNVIDLIAEIRSQRESSASKRGYDQRVRRTVANNIGLQPQTLDDYADLSFRYLRATGAFSTHGRGIALTRTMKSVAELLALNEPPPLSDVAYIRRLWNGAELPTDDRAVAVGVIHDLESQLVARGEDVEPYRIDGLSDADLSRIRLDIEERIRLLNEEDYAARQSGCVDEIAAWMTALVRRRAERLPDGDTVVVPSSEAPAYLEWVIWRAFLAIDSLTNKPSEARRFQIDQDYLPVSTAPGRGPDMVFEFRDVVVVVEATLTSSSRQEAAEGEPVRRHVAEYAERFRGSKDVYGLFIAIEIDSNTAHTFRFGDWYMRDDTKLNLQIVPMRLEDFRNLLVAGREYTGNTMARHLIDTLVHCRARANTDAPLWKASIQEVVARKVRELAAQNPQ